jgi:UPF0755 protein
LPGFKDIFIAALLFAAIIAVSALIWLDRQAQAPGPLTADKLFYIEPGSPVRSITENLLDAGIIRNDRVFLIEAIWRNRGENLKAGEYRFPAGISIGGIITLLQSGKTWQRQITIPEGLTVSEIIALLQGEEVLRGAVATLPAEGILLPETYNFSYGDQRSSLIERMKKSMREELAALWEKRAEGLPFKTPQEAVILASIVEKETRIPEERPRVARVFLNRLARGIPLQSDPTVIYAVTQGKEKLERSLTYQDLKTDSPYNTYVVKDLPPTPIANPGKSSIAAALHPESNDYIYFVADGTGGHVFAKTLKEHNNNVAHWRRVQKGLK